MLFLSSIRGWLRQTYFDLIRRAAALWLRIAPFGVLNRDTLWRETVRQNRLWFYAPRETIHVTQPVNPEPLPPVLDKKPGARVLPRPFVCEVDDVDLIGPFAIGCTHDRQIILETTAGRQDILQTSLQPRTLWQMAPLALRSSPSGSRYEFEHVCSLVNVWSRGYFHWLLDCLIRLEGVEHYCAMTGRTPLLLIDANPAVWQTDSLHLLGYAPHTWTEWPGTRARARHLVVPSFRRDLGCTPISGCRWLHERVLGHLPPDTATTGHVPRILISRRKAFYRHIVNENELLRILAPLGFRAYVLEDMPFAEQVALFAQAEIIVGPHGAGLTNMIWARQQPLIIELFGSYLNSCFYTLAAGLGFRYSFVRCVPHGRDMIADTEQVAALVRAYG